jgi:thiamine biosynthesis protein ThiS
MRGQLPFEAFMLQIQLNGDPHSVAAASTVAMLVASLGLEPTKVAVERNLEIVPKSLYGDTLLCTGDRIEIVHFVGGG